MSPRLITRTDVLQQLLAAIAVVPEGVKLSIPQLRDQLVSQLDVIHGIDVLIAAGALDPKTLRPFAARQGAISAEREAQPKVVKLPPAKEFRPTGAELAAEVEAEARRRKVSKADVCLEIFGNKNALWILKRGVRAVSRKMYAKVEAWLAQSRAQPAAEEAAPEEQAATNSPPPAPIENQGCAHASLTESGDGGAKSETGPVAQPPSSPAPVAPHHPIIAEIEAFLAERSQLTPTRFGILAVGDRTFVGSMRKGRKPGAKTVERVRAFMAWYGREPVNEAAPSARDLTRSPETPMMDLRDKQVLNGRRHVANVRRGQEEKAAAKLDSGEAPSNSFEKSLMANIERRRADEARQADPVEIAKLALRRRGKVVFNCSVTGGREDRFTVSGCRDEETGKNIQFDAEALIALARKINPAVMEAVA